MCHHVPVTLSAEEKRAVTRLSAILAPACAVLVLAVIAGVALTDAPGRHERVAAVAAAPSR